MSTTYGGYRTYAARESTLTWAPGVPSRSAQDSIYHSKRFSCAVPDAAETGATCAGGATAHLTKEDFRAVPRKYVNCPDTPEQATEVLLGELPGVPQCGSGCLRFVSLVATTILPPPLPHSEIAAMK